MALHGEEEGHLAAMQDKLIQSWEHLNGIWEKVGYEGDHLLRRRKAVVKHMTELLSDMCQEADSNLEEQRQAIQTLIQEIQQLAKDLSINQVPELNDAADKPLLEMQRICMEVVEDLRRRKALRMEKYNKINAKVIELSQELDEEPMKIEFEGIPADSEVTKLEHHLAQLHREKVDRLDQFHGLRKSVSQLFQLLERSPKTPMELLAVNNDAFDSNHTVSSNGVKVLSRETLQNLEEIERNCSQEIEANSERGEFLWQKIRELWTRLNADEEMMNSFSHVHRPISVGEWNGVYKPSVIKGLEKELERLEEEKRQNMSLFIEKCRQEMCDLWLNKCFMSSVQDRFMEPTFLGITPFAITDFNDEVYTEELLLKHENELDYWKNFIERNKKIIDGVSKRGEMFSQYKILDQKSDDPSRLANRGGALLKEEKERKRLEKAIPKLEAELKQLCNAFEENRDSGYGMTKFLVYGRTIDEMIEEDWDQFHEEKRLRKEAKKNPKDTAATGPNNKTMMTTQLGSQGTRKRPAPTTPSSAHRSGVVTPVKRNRTTALTPGKTIQSPFVHPSSAAAPSNSAKRPLNNAPQVPKQSKTQGNQSMHKGWQYRPRPAASSSQAVSKKIVRKSIDKLRNASSLLSGSSSSSGSSSKCYPQITSSQPNLQKINIGSLEHLNFTKIVRGHGPPVTALSTPPKSNDHFVQPSAITRSAKKTPSKTGTGLLTRQPSAGKIVLPTKLTGKEQIPPASDKNDLKESILSPVNSYSEFTDHLLCQSTLNSSAVVPVQKHGSGSNGATTPTKSGMSFAPAKLPLTDNRF